MNFIRLYARVLKLLGDESRLGWMLAIANVSLAAAQFAEPVLFGRIVDTLAGTQSRGSVPAWTDVTFSILGSNFSFIGAENRSDTFCAWTATDTGAPTSTVAAGMLNVRRGLPGTAGAFPSA